MKILAISDQVIDRLFPLAVQGHFREVSMVLACGDLPYSYLENLVSVLNVPLYYIPGNHDPAYNPHATASHAEGCTNLDQRLTRDRGLLLAGLGGSIRYRPDGTNQYTQAEATARSFALIPALLWNRLRGHRVDIIISHSPPFGIHDSDGAHTGLKALNLLIRWARPRYLLHGHTHFYRNNLEPSATRLLDTIIVNVYPYKLIEIGYV